MNKELSFLIEIEKQTPYSLHFSDDLRLLHSITSLSLDVLGI